MLDLLLAIRNHNTVELELLGGGDSTRRSKVLPLKIFISVQGGRQYLAAYNTWRKKVCFFRLDSIQKIRQLEVVENYDDYKKQFENGRSILYLRSGRNVG